LSAKRSCTFISAMRKNSVAITVHLAAAIKGQVDVPVITAGRITTGTLEECDVCLQMVMRSEFTYCL